MTDDRRYDLDFLYLATDGEWFKIGATKCVEARIKQIRSPRGPWNRPKPPKTSLVDFWYMPGFADRVELKIKRFLRKHRAYDGSYEWFKDVTEREFRILIEVFEPKCLSESIY